MLAAAVRVDGTIERDVGRIVLVDDRLDVFEPNLGLDARRRLTVLLLKRAPAVVPRLAGVALEAVRETAGGAAAFEGREWNEGFGHGGLGYCDFIQYSTDTRSAQPVIRLVTRISADNQNSASSSSISSGSSWASATYSFIAGSSITRLQYDVQALSSGTS